MKQYKIGQFVKHNKKRYRIMGKDIEIVNLERNILEIKYELWRVDQKPTLSTRIKNFFKKLDNINEYIQHPKKNY